VTASTRSAIGAWVKGRQRVAEQLVIPGSEGSALIVRELAYATADEQATKHVLEPHAPRTRRAYRVQWDHWGRYCAARGITPLPIQPAQVIGYLQLRTIDGAAPNSVRLALSALSVLDQAARVTALERRPVSLRSDPIVQRWLRGWSRENPKAPRKKAPAVTARELELVIQAAAERPPGASRAQHVALYARDRALILLGVTGALRVSELVALDVADVSRTDRGLQLYVRRSKVDQHGEGHVRAVLPQGRTLRCPVDAWRAWLDVRGTEPGPAFVGFDRSARARAERLSDSSARRIVTRRAAAVGLELVTSHSMRATFATLAAEQGKPLHRIAEQGAWSSLDVLRGYIRQGELFQDNPTSALLDD
jgi:integrase